MIQYQKQYEKQTTHLVIAACPSSQSHHLETVQTLHEAQLVEFINHLHSLPTNPTTSQSRGSDHKH